MHRHVRGAKPWRAEPDDGRLRVSMIDQNDYPTEDHLDSIQNAKSAKEALGLAAEYLNAYREGSAVLIGGEWTLVTSGWSGCEDVIGRLMLNPYANQCWESSHRGGVHVFKVEP